MGMDMSQGTASSSGRAAHRDTARVAYARILKLFTSFRYKRTVANAYDAAADFYDDWDWQVLWRKTEWPKLRSVLRQPQRVLEIGIGTGAVAERILDEAEPSVARYVGVDISAGMLERCRARLGTRVELCEADASRMDFARFGTSFDFVLACRMLGHIQWPDRMFADVSRVLAPGGLFAVTDLDPRHAYSSTRLPIKDGRIEVPTFKHDPDHIIAAAEANGMRLLQLHRTYEDAASKVSDAPRSLRGRRGPLSNLFVFEKAPL